MAPRRETKVVISWSGETSGKVALALSRFLKLTLHACEPWTSVQNVAGGSFWHEELWKALKAAHLGILCMTRGNVESKWIHFEGGAIARSFGRTFACPYLLDVEPSEMKGPLEHLKCLKANEQDTLHLVKAINATLRVGRLDHELLLASFAAHWPALQNTLEKVIKEEQAGRRESVDHHTAVIDAEVVDDGEQVERRTHGMTPLSELASEPASHAEAFWPRMTLDFSSYSAEMLSVLLERSRQLDLLVRSELQARRRRLLPDSDTADS